MVQGPPESTVSAREGPRGAADGGTHADHVGEGQDLASGVVNQEGDGQEVAPVGAAHSLCTSAADGSQDHHALPHDKPSVLGVKAESSAETPFPHLLAAHFLARALQEWEYVEADLCIG